MDATQQQVLTRAVALARLFEGCRLKAYWDARGGKWTVGWGCTGAGIGKDTQWTQARADAELDRRMGWALGAALHVSPGLADAGVARQAAIADFVYNLGAGDYAGSTLRKCVDASDWPAAAAQIAHWDHAGADHEVLPGLQRRRAAEAGLLTDGA